MNHSRSTLELLSEAAEKNISTSIARVAGSVVPSIDRTAGEIDMAYKLKLIGYPRRDVLMGQLSAVVNARRTELREQHHARLLRAE